MLPEVQTSDGVLDLYDITAGARLAGSWTIKLVGELLEHATHFLLPDVFIHKNSLTEEG